MRILQILYYYEPYTSGLTIYAQRLANELAARGHDVRVLSSKYDSALPAHERNADGVDIHRIWVAMGFDRAVILPALIPTAVKAIREADVVQIHMPLVESALIVALARLMGKRTVVTHHADLTLEGSFLTRFAASVSKWSGIAAGLLADAFVTNTLSRARVSPTARFMRRNLHIIPPPIIVPAIEDQDDAAFRDRFDLGSGPVIGYVGRYTSEKGIDILLRTIPTLLDRYPTARVALVGPMRDPRDGTLYRGPWDDDLQNQRAAIRQLDRLSDDDLARFYAAIDVLVLPSVDWTESFGMVQIEAMLQGTPVVASDLPGVADPICRTGYGVLARPGDAESLAQAILQVLDAPTRFAPDPKVVHATYSLDATVTAYEQVYAGTHPTSSLAS